MARMEGGIKTKNLNTTELEKTENIFSPGNLRL
jgi:hypothetical protein